jgi:hypothetical protein
MARKEQVFIEDRGPIGNFGNKRIGEGNYVLRWFECNQR